MRGDDEAMGCSSLDTGMLEVDRIGGYELIIEKIRGILQLDDEAYIS